MILIFFLKSVLIYFFFSIKSTDSTLIKNHQHGRKSDHLKLDLAYLSVFVRTAQLVQSSSIARCEVNYSLALM